MDVFRELLHRVVKGPKDVVGLDLAGGNVKAVRLRREKGEIHLVAADFLPGLSIPPPEGQAVESLILPKALCAHYAALAVPAPEALVKLLHMPGRFSEKDEHTLLANLGAGQDDSCRIGYSVISSSGARGETRILAVAFPEENASAAVALLPKGRPAPCSLEVSGLAALSGIAHGLGEGLTGKTVGILEGGETMTTFAVFHNGNLVLIRRFEFGLKSATAKTAEKLGVDIATAQVLMSDSSFDVSSILQQSLESSFKQIVISKEFVERRENCRLSEILLSGALSSLRGMEEAVKQFLGVDVRKWNPFAGFVVPSGVLPESLSGGEAQFTAAFGAAVAVLAGES